jgi:hypothetical protein
MKLRGQPFGMLTDDLIQVFLRMAGAHVFCLLPVFTVIGVFLRLSVTIVP